MTNLELTTEDRAMLEGQHGEAAALAMRVLARSATLMGATRLLDIESAHIDGCLYHGQASLDFVERLIRDGGRVRVPTTLNVGSIDLIHPELFRGDEPLRSAGSRLMEAHLKLGCESTFTCAPYQLKHRPKLGQQIAWAESNAIVFANSVLGARTNRYGDFIDLCSALTGRAPASGLHLTENRYGQVLFDIEGFPSDVGSRDIAFALVGFLVGESLQGQIPVISGLPGDTTEDELKALGAAAASSGAVGMFHAVGITPEAPTLEAALGGRRPSLTSVIAAADLRETRAKLNKAKPGDPLGAVSVGTPHFSLAEFATLGRMLDECTQPLKCDFYVNTSRFILRQLENSDIAEKLARHGVEIVTDTCTYITPIIKESSGLVMTNSGKWAHYAPSNIGVQVAFGSLLECVQSAMRGEVWFDAH